MNGNVCLTHEFAPAPCEGPDPRPCEMVPVDLLVGVRVSYQVECKLCGGGLQGGEHSLVTEALADRAAHVRSHERGFY